MQQVAPMIMMCLFIIFSMTFFMFSMMNYNMIKSKHKKKLWKKVNSLNWLS